jgi:hypothetical protein
MTGRRTCGGGTVMVSDAGRAAAFDFLRLVRDPDFRRLLDRLGYEPGQNMVIADDDEPFVAVISRLIAKGMAPPCLIVIPHEGEPLGFRFINTSVADARPWRRRPPMVTISPESSVGMLYSALGPCGEFIPSGWTQPMRLER